MVIFLLILLCLDEPSATGHTLTLYDDHLLDLEYQSLLVYDSGVGKFDGSTYTIEIIIIMQEFQL